MKDYENSNSVAEKAHLSQTLKIKIPATIAENLTQEFDPEDPRYLEDPDLLVEKIITSFTGLKLPIKYPAKNSLFSNNSILPYHLASLKSPVRKPPLFHGSINQALTLNPNSDQGGR